MKKDEYIISFVLFFCAFIVLLIVAFAYVVTVKDNNTDKIYENDNGESVTYIQTHNTEQQSELTTNNNICTSFTTNYPTYFFVKEMQCNMAGGTYVCDSDKIGCIDITSWDSSLCSSSQVQVLKAFCSTLNAKWTCTPIKISCEALP